MQLLVGIKKSLGVACEEAEVVRVQNRILGDACNRTQWIFSSSTNCYQYHVEKVSRTTKRKPTKLLFVPLSSFFPSQTELGNSAANTHLCNHDQITLRAHCSFAHELFLFCLLLQNARKQRRRSKRERSECCLFFLLICGCHALHLCQIIARLGGTLNSYDCGGGGAQ